MMRMTEMNTSLGLPIVVSPLILSMSKESGRPDMFRSFITPFRTIPCSVSGREGVVPVLSASRMEISRIEDNKVWSSS
jgi:hypothetical protein